jgi:hypothetical protein
MWAPPRSVTEERAERGANYRPFLEVEEIGPDPGEEYAAFYARWVAEWDAHMLDCPGCLKHGGGFCPEGERLALAVATIEPKLGAAPAAAPLDLEGVAVPSPRWTEILRPGRA